MVLSKIDSSISYEEFKALSKDDKDLEASLFVISVLDIPIICTIGNEKYTHISKNVLYVPIYLIYDSKVIGKIGVYEFPASTLPDLMDEDDDLDVTKMGEPITFKYVTKDYLIKYKYVSDSDSDDSENVSSDEEDSIISKSDEDESDEDSDEDSDAESVSESDKDESETSDLFKISGASSIVKSSTELSSTTPSSLFEIQDETKEDSVLPQEVSLIKELYEEDNDDEDETQAETKTDADKLKKQYKDGTNWIQKYFRNNNYNIIDNEGGGDCLFAVVRDAFLSIGKDVTVSQLRNIVAREATQETFTQFKTLYDDFNKEYDSIEKQMRKLISDNNKLKTEIAKEKNREKRKIILDRSRKIVLQFNKLKEERRYTGELLNEYTFMKGINNLSEFKNIIKTCKFWAETWAISTLERALNIKLIILSQEAYHSGDIGNVLQCGQLNDDVLKEQGEFKPKYYIMTEWLGYHYKTITYKTNKILTFDQIPFDIKALVTDKCLERGEGPFGIIPKFKKMKIAILEEEARLMAQTEEEQMLMESKESERNVKAKEEGLYSDGVIFQYYDKSADTKPGKGAGEKIESSRIKEFGVLSGIKNWRRLLSNYGVTEFTLDDKKWLSVAHYFEASKYKKSNPEIYRLFSLDSESEISSSIPAVKALRSKRIFNGKEYIPYDVKVDEDFETRAENEMLDALKAKFTQNKEAKTALKETKDAKLILYNRRKAPLTQFTIMQIRKDIQ